MAPIVIYYLQFSDFIFHSTNEIFFLFLQSLFQETWIYGLEVELSKELGKEFWIEKEESGVWAGPSPFLCLFSASLEKCAPKKAASNDYQSNLQFN